MFGPARSDTLSLPNARPGTACLDCRRRKLKCDRQQPICSNCTRADVECVYPVPETGVKRKRGPYNKDKSAAQRQRNDSNKHRKPETITAVSSSDSSLTGARRADAARPDGEGLPDRTVTATETDQRQITSEVLVEDALFALGGSPVSRQHVNVDKNAQSSDVGTSLATATAETSRSHLHPPVHTIFEYWQLYITRVDPLIKIIHCSTFASKVLTACADEDGLEPSHKVLLHSIYYAAIASCTPSETQTRFGVTQEALLQRYGTAIEGAIAGDYDMPALESVQALVMYIICIRRLDNGTTLRALFGLAVRMAQLIGLHEDPGTSFTPFEAEYRRRLWWHVCGQESRGAEEVGARSTSLMQNNKVRLPANLNDCDLNPKVTEIAASRVGVTDSTFIRLRFHILQLGYRIWALRREHADDRSSSSLEKLKVKQRQAFEALSSELDNEYSRHFSSTRPYDWMCSRLLKGMLVKARMTIDHPFCQTPSRDMTPHRRYRILQTSVLIICDSHSLATDLRIKDWAWYFRGYVQWHALGVVVAELGRITSQDFVRHAWAVLDPILANWEKMYQKRRGEADWDHVNVLIERAKEMRRHTVEVVTATTETALQMSQEAVPTAPGTMFDTTMLQLSTPTSVDASLLASSLENPPQNQLMANFENDFGTLGNIEDIDLDAFDTVFGCADWDLSMSSA